MSKKEKRSEIRFGEFTEDWERAKFEQLGSVLMCKRIFKEQTSQDEEVPFFKIGTFGATPDAFISRELFNEYKSKYPYPEKGSILISASGSIGRTVEFSGKDEYFQDSNIVWLKHDTRLDDTFLKYLYEVVEWAGIEGSTIKRLYNDNILKTEIRLPSVMEQAKIGTFFRNLDNIITLHQHKYDKLVIIKKSMLEKMFPKDGANVPEIRFAGFADAWEQRKVGEIIEDYIEKTVIQNQFPVLTSSQQKGIVLQEDYFADRQVTTNDNCGYYILPKGYFTYRSRSDTDLFVFNRNNLIDKGIISYYYPVFKPRNVDSNFLLRRLNHGIKRQLAMAAEGTGQRVLAHNKFKNMIISVPDIKEQQQIGSLFESLDNLINLHQRELEKLKNIKQSLLEKMFA